jgi:hypothetical protein
MALAGDVGPGQQDFGLLRVCLMDPSYTIVGLCSSLSASADKDVFQEACQEAAQEGES